MSVSILFQFHLLETIKVGQSLILGQNSGRKHIQPILLNYSKHFYYYHKDMELYNKVFLFALLSSFLSLVASQGNACSKASIEACSPSFNGSDCCRCRGNPLFMLNVGLATGHYVLVSVCLYNLSFLFLNHSSSIISIIMRSLLLVMHFLYTIGQWIAISLCQPYMQT